MLPFLRKITMKESHLKSQRVINTDHDKRLDRLQDIYGGLFPSSYKPSTETSSNFMTPVTALAGKLKSTKRSLAPSVPSEQKLMKQATINLKVHKPKKKVIISTHDVDKSILTVDNLPNESTIDLTDRSRLSTGQPRTSRAKSRNKIATRTDISDSDRQAYTSYREKIQERAKSQLETPSGKSLQPIWSENQLTLLKEYQKNYKESYKDFTDREVAKISSSRMLRYIDYKKLQKKSEIGRAHLTNFDRKSILGI